MPKLSRLGVAFLVTFLALTTYGASQGLSKVLVIGWIGLGIMVVGAVVSIRTANLKQTFFPAWAYGLASGAMIISATIFLVPSAIDHHATLGGAGVGIGILVGYSSHTLGHRLTHADLPFEHTTLEIGAHALAAGSIIGIVYGNMPELGLLLGLAIVSHKGPAGYAVAERLSRADKPVSFVLFPAAGFGSAAILTALFSLPPNPALNAVVFGFASGIFLHVAMDFSPRCEIGGEVFEVTEVAMDAHHLLDRLRLHVVASMSTGGLAVLIAWYFVATP